MFASTFVELAVCPGSLEPKLGFEGLECPEGSLEAQLGSLQDVLGPIWHTEGSLEAQSASKLGTSAFLRGPKCQNRAKTREL